VGIVSSSFFGLNVAVSGFFTSQTALDVINHNISNSAKEGYSKQTVDLEANMPMSLSGEGMLGSGCSVVDITRVRDEYLDYKYWGENQKSGEWGMKYTGLSEVTSLFNESSTTGITKSMNDFYSSLQDLSKYPANDAYRGNIKENAITFTKTINDMAHKLFKEQGDVDSEISSKVDQVNAYANQIAGINKQIFNLELDGHTANDLRDQRTVLVDKLSKIVNIDVTENTDSVTNMKKMTIKVGNTNLIDHCDVNEMVVQKNKKNLGSDGKVIENTDYPFLNSITWANSKTDVAIKSGELKGLLDVRDGDGGYINGATGASVDAYRGVNFYIKRLDQFASNFAEKFNEQNKSGYTNENPPVQGGNFFDADGGGTIKAYNIKISDDIKSNLKKIAASDNGSKKDDENAKNILKMINGQNDTTFFSDTTLPQGTPGDFVKSIISSLAVDSQQTERFNNNQSVMVTQIDTRRTSVSGVDKNEEVADAMKYQQTYQASAKMINVMDELYDTIINRLGLVGR
jgi:flagellar hook-associated protein 1 FlgK